MSFKNRITTRYGPGAKDMIEQLEKTLVKKALNENHLTFLIRCKNFGVIPKGLALKSPLSDKKSKRVIQMASINLLKNRIHQVRLSKYILVDKSERLIRILNETLNEQDYKAIINTLMKKYNRVFQAKKSAQKRKFDELIFSMEPRTEVSKSSDNMTAEPDVEIDKLVVNMSGRLLDDKEKLVLAKGLGFTIAPNHLSHIDVVTSIETAACLLPNEVKDIYRCNIVDTLKHPVYFRTNISEDEMKSLKRLKNDQSIVTLPSDKGGAVVILNKSDYNNKLIELVNGGQYRPLNKNPTNVIQTKIKNALKKIKGVVSENTYYQLSPQFSKPPHLYGLPKLHKAGVPLRPIVSSIGSPSYELSKYLLPIVSPLFGSSPTYVKNSEQFVEVLKLVELTENTLMVSFDVTNLFTNVPVTPCLDIVRTLLENDKTLSERTKLPVSTIVELISVCVNNNYFQVDTRFYEQTTGLAMGGVLSPVLSNIFMENFENKALNNYYIKPKLWLRYVDDIFCLWEESDTELFKFKDYLNQQTETIRFTLEVEDDGKIPFLDVLVDKSSGQWQTSVYRKPTATGRYLNFKSNHPNHVKQGLAVGLIKKAKAICSNEDNYNKELAKIKQCLRNSGYPDTVFFKALNKLNKFEQLIEKNNEKPVATVSIPYVKNWSEKIRRLNAKYNIRTVFKSSGTIRSMVTSVKPVVEPSNKNVVYKVPCSCNRNYIGQTSRPVHIRIEEHMKKVKNREVYGSKICDHVMETGHNIRWEDSTILYTVTNWRKRNLTESLFMGLEKDPLSNPSIEISPVYKEVVRQEVDRLINRRKIIKISKKPPPSPFKPASESSSAVVVQPVRRSTRILENAGRYVGSAKRRI